MEEKNWNVRRPVNPEIRKHMAIPAVLGVAFGLYATAPDVSHERSAPSSGAAQSKSFGETKQLKVEAPTNMGSNFHSELTDGVLFISGQTEFEKNEILTVALLRPGTQEVLKKHISVTDSQGRVDTVFSQVYKDYDIGINQGGDKYEVVGQVKADQHEGPGIAK